LLLTLICMTYNVAMERPCARIILVPLKNDVAVRWEHLNVSTCWVPAIGDRAIPAFTIWRLSSVVRLALGEVVVDLEVALAGSISTSGLVGWSTRWWAARLCVIAEAFGKDEHVVAYIEH
jgi:hypothetical protein